MKVEFNGNYIVVTKEGSDPIFRNTGWGLSGNQGESRFLYHLKKLLNSMGFDLIKKRMTKDGHLTDEGKQYLRARKPSGDPKKDIAIYNPRWAIEGAEVDFNIEGKVILQVVYDIFSPEQI